MDATHEELSRLSDLIGLIYEGATDPSRWTEDILPAVTQYIQARLCVLFTPQLMPQDGGFSFIHGMTQKVWDSYANRYQSEDLLAIAAFEKGLVVEGNVMVDSDIVPRHQLVESRYFKEFLCVVGLDKLMTTVVFGLNSISGLPPVVCTFWRGMDEPEYTERDRARLKLLMPHLSRSLGVKQRLRTAELNAATGLAALDRLPSGVLLIDGAGEVSFANRSAQRMLAEGDGLRLRNLTNRAGLGVLVAEDVTANRAITEAISASLSRDELATPHFSKYITVPGTAGLARHTLQFSALGDHNEFGGESGQFAAIIFLADGAQKIEIDAALLQSAYGLTPAEVRVAVALLESGSAQEVADALKASPHTVHTQIKAIYAKLGVNTRTRFVKLLMGLACQRS